MSEPFRPDDVKLISSLFSSNKALIAEVIRKLEGLFSPIDWTSPELLFDRTQYYAKEMGWPLHRLFVSFEKLISPEDLIEVKLETNRIEKAFLRNGGRQVNIDPGYISLERLILATGKNYTHRVYLAKGIFADLTLLFNKGSFRPLEWTFKDYASPEIISLFNEVRERYKRQLRGTIED